MADKLDMMTNPDNPPAPARSSLAELVSTTQEVSWQQSLPGRTLLKIAVCGTIVVAMNYRQFPTMFYAWMDNLNWSHGFLIPLFSLWLLYVRRRELLSAPRSTSLWGLALLLVSGAGQVLAYWIRNPWLEQITMLGVVLGLVLYLGGWSVLRMTWLPILFLALAMPIPEIYYGRIALHLQNWAASSAMYLLRLLGVDITANSSQLTLISLSGVSRNLVVEEACSGVRLLMAFLALSVAFAYLEQRPIWHRVVMVAMGIPVAIACNILRVSITCLMFYWDHPEGGSKFMHEFTGMLMLVPALGMLWLVGRILQGFHLYVEVDEQDGTSAEEVSS